MVVLFRLVYCAPTDKQGDPTLLVECDDVDDLYFDSRVGADLRRMGVGGFMTEWGAMQGDAKALQNIDHLTSLADAKKQSWTYWQFKSFHDITTASVGPAESFYDQNGALYTDKVTRLARTYPPIVAGEPLSWAFNITSGKFTLKFAPSDAPGNSTTVINFANGNRGIGHYPNGVSVSISPSSSQVNITQPYSGRVAITVAPNSGIEQLTVELVAL